MSKTNFGRIKEMTIDELAAFLLIVNKSCNVNCTIFGGNCKWEDYPTHDKGCKDCFKEWLEMEVEE